MATIKTSSIIQLNSPGPRLLEVHTFSCIRALSCSTVLPSSKSNSWQAELRVFTVTFTMLHRGVIILQSLPSQYVLRNRALPISRCHGPVKFVVFGPIPWNRLVKPVKRVFSPWNPDFLYLNYQISGIIHFKLQFPARDVQTRSDFNRPNHQNEARETLYPITSNNET